MRFDQFKEAEHHRLGVRQPAAALCVCVCVAGECAPDPSAMKLSASQDALRPSCVCCPMDLTPPLKFAHETVLCSSFAVKSLTRSRHIVWPIPVLRRIIRRAFSLVALCKRYVDCCVGDRAHAVHSMQHGRAAPHA
jgi:hypothetical protein